MADVEEADDEGGLNGSTAAFGASVSTHHAFGEGEDEEEDTAGAPHAVADTFFDQFAPDTHDHGGAGDGSGMDMEEEEEEEGAR